MRFFVVAAAQQSCPEASPTYTDACGPIAGEPRYQPNLRARSIRIHELDRCSSTSSFRRRENRGPANAERVGTSSHARPKTTIKAQAMS